MMCVLCNAEGSIKHLESLPIKNIVARYEGELKAEVSKCFARLKKIDFVQCDKCGLKFFTPSIEGSKEFYEALYKQNKSLYYLEEKEEFGYAASWIFTGAKVLEIGAGSGNFAKNIPQANYTGLELSDEAIGLARDRGIKILPQFLNEHLVDHGEYDVVCAFQVLEHIGDVHTFIKDSVKALKKGGLLIYTVPSDDSFVSLVKNNNLNMPPHHLTRWPDKALNSIESLFGLKLKIIHHHPLEQVHIEWFKGNISLFILGRLFGLKNSVLDASWRNKFLKKILRFAVVRSIVAPLFEVPGLSPNGHSVTVVLEK